MEVESTGTPASASLHVTHILHNLGPGGAQELLVTLAQKAASAGFRLSVISVTATRGLEHSRRLEELGVPVASLGLTSSRDPRATQRLLRMLRRLRPDVLHSHGKQADLLAAVTAPLLFVPRVSTVHLVEQPTTTTDRALLATLAAARRVAGGRTLMVSCHQRDRYVTAYPRSASSTHVIYNGVPSPLDSARPVDATQGSGRSVLALGLLRPDRGHQTLIDAAAHLSPSVTVLVAGDGPLREQLVLRARRTGGRAATVRFLGYRSDLSALLRRADVLVHPSFTDALPTAVIHALAHGVPVVASAVDGIPEIVSPDVGILVPPGDSRALAGAIVELLEDPARRTAMAIAGRARYELMFSADEWAANLRACYAQLMARKL